MKDMSWSISTYMRTIATQNQAGELCDGKVQYSFIYIVHIADDEAGYKNIVETYLRRPRFI